MYCLAPNPLYSHLELFITGRSMRQAQYHTATFAFKCHARAHTHHTTSNHNKHHGLFRFQVERLSHYMHIICIVSIHTTYILYIACVHSAVMFASSPVAVNIMFSPYNSSEAQIAQWIVSDDWLQFADGIFLSTLAIVVTKHIVISHPKTEMKAI